MTNETDRLDALEHFVVRLTRQAGSDWIAYETSATLQEAVERPEARDALIATAELITKGVAYQKQLEARLQSTRPSAKPSAPQPSVDSNELLRRNSLILDRYDREVGISKSYAAVISGAGYAGLLAIWSGLRDHLDPSVILLTGALIGLSVAVFVFWEMMKVRVSDQASAAWAQVVKTKFHALDFDVAAGAAQAKVIADTTALNKHQPLIFWTSTVTGFLAAAILIVASVGAASGLHLAVTVTTGAPKSLTAIAPKPEESRTRASSNPALYSYQSPARTSR